MGMLVRVEIRPTIVAETKAAPQRFGSTCAAATVRCRRKQNDIGPSKLVEHVNMRGSKHDNLTLASTLSIDTHHCHSPSTRSLQFDILQLWIKLMLIPHARRRSQPWIAAVALAHGKLARVTEFAIKATSFSWRSRRTQVFLWIH